MAGQAKTAHAPRRLRTLDDMYGLSDAVETSSETPSDGQNTVITNLDIDLPTPFRNHPFRLYEGERLDDMTESIRKNGILVPVIVRCAGSCFEILSGHNRINAARLAGNTTVPAIIKENLSDDDAWAYVIETNLIQRSFADMLPSEKAAVLHVQHSKMFSQGKRNDIISELERLSKPHDSNENETLPQVGARLRTDEKIGDAYGLSKNSVARYLRVYQLECELKARVDSGELSFIPAVTISFLKAFEQKLLDKCIEQNKFTVDMRKAEILRDYSTRGKLDVDNIYLILNGELGQPPKKNSAPVIKVSKSVYSKYFTPNQPAKAIQEYVEKALEFYAEHLSSI